MPVIPDESMYDEDVTEDDDAAGQCADDCESYPRPHVSFEVAVLRARPAAGQVQDALRRAVAARPDYELWAASPKNVEVLSDGGQQRPGREVLRRPRLAGR